MRRWVIGLAVMFIMPWAVSLVWMRSAGMEVKAEQGEVLFPPEDEETEQTGQAEDRANGNGASGEEEGTEGEFHESNGNQGNGGKITFPGSLHVRLIQIIIWKH